MAAPGEITPYLRRRYLADFLVAILLLVLISPILIVTAILVASDGGPIFFRQERTGAFGKVFRVFKFRSMIVDADDYLNERGEVTRDRITKVGKLIRKTSIDELPQIFNILLGQMAFVGPRPTLTVYTPYMTDFEKKRFLARPGITGLAQVNGRNSVKWSERFKMDVEYVENASFALDVKISIMTIKQVAKSADISEDRNTGQVDDVTIRKRPK
jgi:lipopolysaccharide/colanic/teichoic acid biosynthesis glycosyltransferase